MLRAALVVVVALAGAACKRDEPAPPATAPGGPTAPALDPALVVAVDARIELVSIVARLAGFPEYGEPARTAYLRAADAHFAPWRDHPAVARARGLRAEHGIAFNAPVSLALYLDDAFAPRRPLRPPLPGLDPRWGPVDLDAVAAELADFARQSDLAGFLAGQRPFLAAVEARVGEALAGHRFVAWLEATFGPRPATFRVIPGLTTGNQAYGAFAVDADGQEQVAQVLYLPPPAADGVPRPGADAALLLVHELLHSYVNPALDADRARLEPVAAPLFARVEAAMARQHYRDVMIMVNESVVRALVVLYARDRGAADVADRQLVVELRSSFLWTRELVAALDGARQTRGGRLPPDVLTATTRDTFAAWAAANP